MWIMLLIGFSQIVLAVMFWKAELTHFTNVAKTPFGGIRHCGALFPLTFDLFVTFTAIKYLGFGGGWMGGVSGLFLSNVISFFIWRSLRKKDQFMRDWTLAHSRAR